MTNNVVKSVGRVLSLLELFRKEQSPMTATEICKSLKYPKSSGDALLKSMVHLGYCSLDAQTMQYFPSLRVTQLGDWLPSMLYGSGETLKMLEELHRKTKETVSLLTPNGLEMQFVTVLPGTYPISLNVKEGYSLPIFETAVGIANLATRTDKGIEKLVQRNNRNVSSIKPRIDLAILMNKIQTARSVGFAVVYARALNDTGAIAMALPVGVLDIALVVGVGGLSERIKTNETNIIQTMRSAIWKLGHNQSELG